MLLVSRIGRFFSSRLRRNITTGTASAVASGLIGLVSYPVYLHFLGYERYGIWLVLTTVLTAGQLGNLGMGPALAKLVAEEHACHNTRGIERYLATACGILLLSGGTLLLVILAARQSLIHFFRVAGEAAQLVSWLLPFIGMLSIYVFLVDSMTATLVGLGRMDLASYSQILAQAIAVAIGTVLLASGVGIESLLMASIASYVSMHLVILVLIRRILPLRVLNPADFDIRVIPRLLKISGWVFGGTLVSMLLGPLNKILLAHFSGVATVPVYEIAASSTMRIRSFIDSGLRAMTPEVSALSARMTPPAARRIVAMNHRGLKLILAVGLPSCAFLYIFATLLLKSWLRSAFRSDLPLAFKLMLIGTFISLLGVPAFYSFLGIGESIKCFYAHTVQALTNLLLVVGVIIAVGTITVPLACAATLIAMTASTAYLLWQTAQFSAKWQNSMGSSHRIAAAEETASLTNAIELAPTSKPVAGVEAK